MATANRQIGGLDTVFLICSPLYSPVSYTHLDVYKRQGHVYDSTCVFLLVIRRAAGVAKAAVAA